MNIWEIGIDRLQCTSLQLIYGQELVQRVGGATFDAYAHGYWSMAQDEASPTCIFKPEDAESIAVLVLISRLTHCPMAVKSGGHASFPGASSISSGINLVLESLNEVTVSADRKVASIGPGNKWKHVYEVLEQQDLAVIGGRVADVGVGGLTLGGGLFFLSNQYGWACDNVHSYEKQVVTASGEIVTASPSENEDLYFALRGGGNNFGIVTKFNLNTIDLPGGILWGGSRTHSEDTFPAIINAFTEMARNSETDPKAGQWLTWTIFNGSKVAVAELHYHDVDVSNAKIFSNHTAINAVWENTEPRKLSEYTMYIDGYNPYGFRRFFYVMSHKNDPVLNSVGKDIFFEEFADLDPSIEAFMTYQSITTSQLKHMTKNGGNPLGISSEDGALTLPMINTKWTNAADDEAIYRAASNTFIRLKAKAVELGLNTDYLYMNYASQYQDVVSSYGEANKRRLKTIAAKYDPAAVFQTLMPGYFKLDHGPVQGADFFNF
ncbi:hypothetical protein ANO11243_093280 [Dothideomycetidae sp. 11243]|nr:hypothetical protein ANO11243_093280 [fungal sp. No.11243]